MEKQPPKTGKFAWTYGLILGSLGVAFSAMFYFPEKIYRENSAAGIAQMIIAAGLIIWAIYSFRKANDGFLKLSQGLKMGTGIMVITGILMILYTILLSNVLDPEFAAKVMDFKLAEAAQESNITPEQMQQQKEMGIKYFWIGYPVILIMYVLFGLVVGLVGGLILKKAQPDY
ncbi:DUF4199 domain-containing protein [Sungkyunkwania multivorans]|uniref:DUF4199 domain-containing protein n=1 Tax=Sungkyunkwania multivorans TaxID=1173618 RepID=A0ABW3CZ41_9FLAO